MSCQEHSCCDGNHEISYEFAPIAEEGIKSIHVYALPEEDIAKPWTKTSTEQLIKEVYPLTLNEDSSDVIIGTFVDGKYQPHVALCASPQNLAHNGINTLANEISKIISKDLPDLAKLISYEEDDSKKTLSEGIPFTFIFSFSPDPEDFSPLIYSFAICDIWQDSEEEDIEEWNPETPFNLIALPFCAVKKLEEGESPEVKKELIYVKKDSKDTFDADKFFVGSPAYADILRYSTAVVAIPVSLPEDKMPQSTVYSHPTLLVALMDQKAALDHCLALNMEINEDIKE